MKIAIYGGSFNPPHPGHRAAAETVCGMLRPDRLLIMPACLPPHKELAENSPTPDERLSLCRLAFAGLPGAEVSDLEIRRGEKSYTADTVAQLREEYPGDELFLVLGTDMLMSFDSWYRADYLAQQCVLTALSRNGKETERLEEKAARLREQGARVLVLPHRPVAESSELIRLLLPKRLGADQLDGAVYAEIIRRRWYGAKPELRWLRGQVYPMLKPSRVPHVAGCEQTAVQLAQRWGEDAELAAEAAILHDATKRLNTEEQIAFCAERGIELTRDELDSPAILHAITGAALARERFGAGDAVADAIRWHTTGRPDMSRLEKIIYLADMVEPTRTFDGVEELRTACFEDLDAALARALTWCLHYVEERGQKLHPISAQAARWYQERL